MYSMNDYYLMLNREPVMDDFYDDCNPSQQPTSAGMTSNDNAEEKEYGEDIYEGVEVLNDDQPNGIEEDAENEKTEQKKVQPPPAQQRCD